MSNDTNYLKSYKEELLENQIIKTLLLYSEALRQTLISVIDVH